MIIETEINVYDVACRLTRAPEEMAYTLQEFALCDAASLGRDCAEHMTHGPRAEVSVWLHAFAVALTPVPEGRS